MYAALFDRKDIVRELMKNGASVNETDLEGRSASSLAREQGNFSMLEVLNRRVSN
ncbi:ankyrin repeat protein [Bacteriovorax sp. Seq25_V]|nr:ankyrin repeat protein [Bacteriovorax sp. Seq25_V]